MGMVHANVVSAVNALLAMLRLRCVGEKPRNAAIAGHRGVRAARDGGGDANGDLSDPEPLI
jgi:hypothetical protein